MAEKKKFLLRIDEKLHAALEKWAADDLRSINAQIEFLLKDALRKAGRLPVTTNNSNSKTTEQT
jgi:hypothetical protein